MKKLLGVSIAAMLAVSPMMANAAPTAADLTLRAADGTAAATAGGTTATTVTANDQLATTSYVMGAYNVLGAEHNKMIDDITVPTAVAGTYEAVANGNSVSENLVALDAKVKTLNASDSSAGSVAYQVKENTQNADYDASDNYANGTIGKAIKTLETTVSAAGVNSTVADRAYIQASNSVADNLTALDEAAETNSAAISAILDSTIPVYGTWGSSSATTSNITIGSLQSTLVPPADPEIHE